MTRQYTRPNPYYVRHVPRHTNFAMLEKYDKEADKANGERQGHRDTVIPVNERYKVRKV